MTLLKTFCRCGTLRTGTLVAGVAGIILAIIGIIVVLTVHSVQIKTIVLDWLPKWIVQIIIIVNFAMTILISTLLIAGTIKRNMYMMLPWVLLGIMLVIGLLVSVLYTSIQLYLNSDPFNGSLWLVFGLIGVVIYIYMWMVVYSFFCVIRQESGRGAYSKDPFRRQYK